MLQLFNNNCTGLYVPIHGAPAAYNGQPKACQAKCMVNSVPAFPARNRLCVSAAKGLPVLANTVKAIALLQYNKVYTNSFALVTGGIPNADTIAARRYPLPDYFPKGKPGLSIFLCTHVYLSR
jgi:hypothetical protein